MTSSPDVAFIKLRKDLPWGFSDTKYSDRNFTSEMVLHHFPKLNIRSLGSSYYQTACPTFNIPVLNINCLFYHCLPEKETLNKQNCWQTGNGSYVTFVLME